MGRRSNRTFGWIVLAVVALLPILARSASLVDRARLREGPGKDTRLLGWVDAGVTVEIESERNGWYSVHTPDGQSGYVWKDHLRFDNAEPAEVPSTPPPTAQTVAPSAAPSPSPPSTIAPVADVRSTGAERTDGDVAAELGRLRTEVARLATAQQDLSQRLARSHDGPAVPIATDGSAGAAVVFFAAGGIIGWAIGRFTAGRRDRRSRIRL